MYFEIPEYVAILMRALNESGYECYVVGGAIRSLLLHQEVHDYDLTTNATPQETKQVFHNYHTIETGMQHGTITVVSNHIPVEITTYRKDTTYKDHRHPDEVIFTTTIQEDCARRDFTINALCYNEKEGLLDFFNGKNDLQEHLIRCIGNPYKRFEEDALRILRAIRFASQLNFAIEDTTSQAILTLKQSLTYVSIERIREEFSKFLVGNGFLELLYPYRKVFSVFLPEFNTMKDWEHFITSMRLSKTNLYVRLAILFSQDCFADSKATIKKMKFSNKEIDTIYSMIHNKDLPLDSKYDILYALHILKCDFETYLMYREAIDCKTYDTVHITYKNILQNKDCYCLKDLAIHGNDVMALGYKGKQISSVLNHALDLVMHQSLENNKDVLLTYIQKNML